MWIDEKKDTFLLRHLPFQTALLSDQAAYEQAVFEVAQSSFYHVDLFKSKKDNLQSMYVYPFINDGQLELDGISHSVSFGDCLISLNRIDEMPEDNLIMFYYTRDKQQIGNGSKEFQVSCVVSDTYTISVFAENEEEAILSLIHI